MGFTRGNTTRRVVKVGGGELPALAIQNAAKVGSFIEAKGQGIVRSL